MSNLIHFKVGFADHRAHPDGITGLPASLGTVCQSSILVNRRESNPRHPGKSIKSGCTFLSVSTALNSVG